MSSLTSILSQYVAVLSPPAAGPPEVKEEEAGSVQPSTAVLHSVVNPDGYDTHYWVEYITQEQIKKNEEEDKEAFAGALRTPEKNLGAVIQNDHVSVPLDNLSPGTSYRWRFVAKSSAEEVKGEASGLATLPPVSIRDFTTQTVAPELVTLTAELNPNNGTGTEYTFRYGETTAYEGGTFRGSLPLSGEFKEVHATFNGLKPNTTYHYQLKARNSHGEEVGSDQTFTTELSLSEELAAEDCPNGSHHGESNSTIREEDGSLQLPDCRAYEQVSEVEKNGGQATLRRVAPSGERVYYTSEGVIAGAAQNLITIQYITHRTANGWVTQPMVGRLAPPPTEPLGTQYMNAELSRWLFLQGQGLNSGAAAEPQASSYFTLGLDEEGFVLHASPVIAPLEGGPRYVNDFTNVSGMSADLSHVLITTGARLLAEDPRPDADGSAGIPPEADRLYELTGVGASSPALHLAAEVPTGLSGEGGFGGGGGCFLDWSPAMVRHGEPEPQPPPTISEDGSTVIYNAPIELAKGYECGEGKPNPYGLFARTGEAPPVQLNAPPPTQCTEGHLCFESEPRTPLYDGTSPDGRRVWFTTTQPLINQDTDETNDLYVAKLTPSGELEELVLASAGKETKSHPTPGTGADVGEDGVAIGGGTDSINQGVIRLSEDGTHAAFESPAVLTEEPNALGQKPVQHANNVYVYDLTTAQTKFVTDLCSGPGQSGSEPGPAAQGDHSVTKEQSVPDPACPATVSNSDSAFIPQGEFTLWDHGNGGEAEMTPNGNFLLFAGEGRLHPRRYR